MPTPNELVNLALTHSIRIKDVKTHLSSNALKCGFPTIEKHEYLMANEGNLVVLSALPGHGKTALACQIGLNVAKHSRVLFFTLEMRAETLKKRLISVLSGVPIKKLGFPQHSETIAQAITELDSHKLDLIDDGDLSIEEIISKISDENQREPLGMVMIDYLGLIRVTSELRAYGIATAVKQLKHLIADRLKIPVLLLCQMNRSFESRYNFADNKEEIKPSLSDLADSSGIERTSDVVLFLQRPYLLDKRSKPNKFLVYACKNRNGEVKDFELSFSQELTKFFDPEEKLLYDY